MSDGKNKGKGIPERAFYDPSVLDHARKKLVELVARRESPIVVTGEPGTGKSVLIRRVIKSLPPKEIPILLAYPRLSLQDVLDIVLKSLHIDNTTSAVDANQPSSLDFVRWCLRKEAAQGRFVTLIIDQAHDLGLDVLTGLFQLVQKPARGNPFLGLVLVGLPTMEARLAQPSVQDLLSTPISYFRLQPLSPEETAEFVSHFFSATTTQGDQAISFDVVAQIRQYSHGILSLTNRLCHALRLVMKKRGATELNEAILNEAASLCSIPPPHTEDPFKPIDKGRPLANAPPADKKTTEQADAPPADKKTTEQADVPPADKKTTRQADATGMEDRSRQKPAHAHRQTEEEGGDPSHARPRETPMNRTERLNKVLKNLQNGSPDVEASALITEDGLMIASSLPQDLDETTVGGMSATLLHLGTRAATELRRGEVKEVIVRGEQGYGVMVSAGRGVLLLVVANERAKLGLIFFDMRTAINAITKIL